MDKVEIWEGRFRFILPWGQTEVSTMTGITVIWRCCFRVIAIGIFGFTFAFESRRISPCPGEHEQN